MPKKSPNPIADALITHRGQTQKLKHWATDLGLSYQLLKTRYRRGDRGDYLLRKLSKPAQTPHNTLIEHNGKVRSVYEWSRIFNIGFDSIMQKLNAGEQDFYNLMGIEWEPIELPITNTTTHI